jgi:glycosyltransferase involved in cell wall biosynthesis
VKTLKPNLQKKICIISPSLKIGGIERALTVLANSFALKGYQVNFISCLKKERFYELNSTVSIVEPEFHRTSSFINKIIYYPRLTFFIRSAVKKSNPDVVLSFGDWFNPLVLFSLLGLPFPVYISDRTSPDYKFNRLVLLAKRLFYPFSKGIIAQTQSAADYKLNQFGTKANICIIPNAVRAIEHFAVNKEKIILYVGRFAWEKNPERLIRDFSVICKSTGWQLQMAGSGPLLLPMKKLVKELNIEESVIFLGDTTSVDYLFAKASIYVLPSVLEGYPNALCEAMAAGLPCICFDTFPAQEIINNNVNGCIVPYNAADGLSNMLAELINNKQKRNSIGLEAKKIAVTNNADAIAERVLAFIFGAK